MAASLDLVTILGELSFPEQIGEVAQYNALGKQGVAAEQEAAARALVEKATAAGDDAAQRKAIVTEAIRGLSAQPGDIVERELEGIFNLVASLIVSTFATDGEAAPLVAQTCKTLTGMQMAADRTVARYRILVNLFNSLPARSANRCVVFKTLLDLASEHDDLELIADALAAVPKWLAEWQIDAAAKADILRTVAAKLEAAGNGKTAYEFQLTLLRFLGISTESGQGSSATATKEVAEQTVALALALPYVFDFEELAAIDAVKNLKGSPVGQLLNVFLQGTTSDFASWRGANAADIARLKLPESQLEHKIRLLDLASLCSQSVSSEVPYSEIAKALKISEDDVEVWAIDVIRAGLVSGKLSQINQSLRVYKSAYRTFGTEQWKMLESRLATWEQSIANILETIADTKQGSTGLPRDVGVPGADASTARQQQQQQQQQQSVMT